MYERGLDVIRMSVDAVEAGRLDWKAEVAEAEQYLILNNIEWWHAQEFRGDEDDQVDQIVECIQSWGDASSPVVSESFTLRQLRADDTLLSPVRVRSKIDYAIKRLGISGKEVRLVRRRCVAQSPSMALGMCTDERLRLWYGGKFLNGTRGMPHGRDAVRHAISFLRREKAARASGKSIENWPWAPILAARVESVSRSR
jgi:hypothetical protein